LLLRPDDFFEKEVELREVFLDPNNPRFSIESAGETAQDKITEESIQQKCLMRMKVYGLEELKESIKRVGFVQIDKVVVRPLKTAGFVVVEGNRRIAALKSLAKELADNEITLDEEIKKTILGFRVVVYNGKEKDIAWIIQGIRHISGVRNWPLYQQAELLIKLSREKKIGVREASNIVGIGPIIAARLVRAWYGYLQARNDEEYGQYMKPGHFSYFAEVIFFKPVLQEWLGWEEKKQRFNELANLKKLLSWIFPEEGKEPRITRAMQLRDTLAEVIGSHPELLKRWENDENMTIERLNFELGKHAAIEVGEWFEKIDDFNREITELPIMKIEPKKNEFKKKLEETLEIVQKHLAFLKKL
jgi:hypothetical protein